MALHLPTKNQAFWTSVILHCVVLFGFFLVTVVQALKPEDKAHVFVMVEPPSFQSQVDVPRPDEPSPEFQLSDIPEMPNIAPIEVSERLPIKEPKSEVIPERPQPELTSQPKEKLMTMEEFLKNNKIREPRMPVAQRPKPREAPKIDTSRMRKELEGMLRNTDNSTQADTLSAATQAELVRYNAKLRARIDGAWVKPANLAGVRLSAEVVFDVSAAGRISNVRLRNASGNSAFDQSILDAFKKMSSAGPTPSGQSHRLSMRFRMTD